MKKENGITLVALVISIIVLLILATVSINTLINEGIIGKSAQAVFLTEIEQYNEELKLAITEDSLGGYGVRNSKFNVRRSNYDDENIFTNAMKSKIPSFNKKYANKLEIKEDQLNYIGEDEQERTWLAQVINVAGMLKINYVYENGMEVFPTYQKVITDGSYEVESPKKDGYEPDHYIVEGTANKDTDVTVTYYGESQGLAYEELSDGTYTVAGIGNFTGENLVIPREYNGKAVTQIKEVSFFKDTTLKLLIVPETVKKINSSAFQSSKIEYINFNGENAYYKALATSNLKKVDIGKNVKNINERIFDSTVLESVKIYTEQADLNAWQFENCSALENIYVNERNNKYKSIDGVVYSKDGKKIFLCGPGRKGKFIIPNHVEKTEYLSFFMNKNLTEIEAYDTLKTIGAYTFQSAAKINTFRYFGTKEQWNNVVKERGWNDRSNINKVICTDGTVDV